MSFFSRPRVRIVVALILFFALSYCSQRFESLLLGPLVGILKAHLHLQFKATFGPKPAVPVNLFTVITIERSLLTLIVTGIALLVARRPWIYAGFSRTHRASLYRDGLISGFLSISILILGIWIGGGLIYDGLRLERIERVSYPLRWFVGMLFAGFEEECGLRGFSLFAFREIIGAWPAALLSAGIFAAGHVGNPGENALGILQVFVFGLLCSINVLRTGSLWWAAAFHASWDWTMESFYGTIGSGYWFDGHLLQFRPRGAELLSGGSAGPEGSLVALLVLITLLAYQAALLRRQQTQGTSSKHSSCITLFGRDL